MAGSRNRPDPAPEADALDALAATNPRVDAAQVRQANELVESLRSEGLPPKRYRLTPPHGPRDKAPSAARHKR
jgi:hypothetical protein